MWLGLVILLASCDERGEVCKRGEMMCQTVFTRFVNQVPRGTSGFVDGILGHHSGWGREKMEEDLRYDFVLKTGEEKYRNFGDGREESVGGPDLVAEEGKVFGRWNDTGSVSFGVRKKERQPTMGSTSSC